MQCVRPKPDGRSRSRLGPAGPGPPPLQGCRRDLTARQAKRPRAREGIPFPVADVVFPFAFRWPDFGRGSDRAPLAPSSAVRLRNEGPFPRATNRFCGREVDCVDGKG